MPKLKIQYNGFSSNLKFVVWFNFAVIKQVRSIWLGPFWICEGAPERQTVNRCKNLRLLPVHLIHFLLLLLYRYSANMPISLLRFLYINAIMLYAILSGMLLVFCWQSWLWLWVNFKFNDILLTETSNVWSSSLLTEGFILLCTWLCFKAFANRWLHVFFN